MPRTFHFLLAAAALAVAAPAVAQELGADVNAPVSTLSAKDIRCDNVGRLTLIAQDILLVGDYDTWINGLAVAGNTITLDDQQNTSDPHGCPYGALKHSDSPAEP